MTAKPCSTPFICCWQVCARLPSAHTTSQATCSPKSELKNCCLHLQMFASYSTSVPTNLIQLNSCCDASLLSMSRIWNTFSIAAPKVWNTTPTNIKSLQALLLYLKSTQKIYLYSILLHYDMSSLLSVLPSAIDGMTLTNPAVIVSHCYYYCLRELREKK